MDCFLSRLRIGMFIFTAPAVGELYLTRLRTKPDGPFARRVLLG